MMGAAMRPYPMMGPCGYPGAGMRGAETAMIAGVMTGVVVAEEVRLYDLLILLLICCHEAVHVRTLTARRHS